MKKIILIIVGLLIFITLSILIFCLPKFLDQLNLIVLSATLLVLIWYAYDTNRIADQAVQQTELTMMPVMSLHVRYINGIKDEQEKNTVREKYAITHLVNNGIVSSPFYLALRNMGNGPAFNVSVESSNFKIERYETNFFAPQPKNDEHAIKVIKKPSNKIRNLAELKNEIFTIRCQSALAKIYEYRYKIIDVNERNIEFID